MESGFQWHGGQKPPTVSTRASTKRTSRDRHTVRTSYYYIQYVHNVYAQVVTLRLICVVRIADRGCQVRLLRTYSEGPNIRTHDDMHHITVMQVLLVLASYLRSGPGGANNAGKTEFCSLIHYNSYNASCNANVGCRNITQS